MKLIKKIFSMIYDFFFGGINSYDYGTEKDHPIDIELANSDDSYMSDEIFILINEYRSSNNLSILKKGNNYSYAYSVRHTNYMISESEINHDDFGIRSLGLKFRGAKRVGEIVAYGYFDAESVLSAWLNSPTHKSVIDGNYTHVGFGSVKNNKGIYYFTELFYHDNS